MKLGKAPDEFSQGCLDTHNKYRRQHGSPPLSWSKELQERAQAWADNLAVTGVAKHDYKGIEDNGEGENIGYFKPSRPKCQGKQSPACYACGETVKDWYDEIENYDFFTGKTVNGKIYLHFTQVFGLSYKTKKTKHLMLY